MLSLKKKGMALPLVILAMVVAAGFVATMSSLNQGVRTQIFQTNNHQLSFVIAYSAMSRVCAKVHSFSWSSRPFLNSAYTENRIPLQGGFYDLFVENTQGKPYQADVYVRTHLANISRMYFWRIRFNDDLLDIANRVEIEAFVNGDPGEFPAAGSPNPFRKKVEDILKKREENRNKAEQLTKEIGGLDSANEIARELNGRKIDKPSDDYPADPEDVADAGRQAVKLPAVPAQNGGEKPSSAGPQNPAGMNNGGISGALQGQAAKIEAAAIEAVKKTDKAWTLMEEGARKSDPKVQELRKDAREARKEAYQGMVDFLDGVAAGIADAPGPASVKAMEQYASQVIVSGIQKLSEEMVRRLERFNGIKRAQLFETEDPDEVKEMIEQWEDVYETSLEQVLEWRTLGNRISGYSRPSEVSSAYSTAMSEAKNALGTVAKFVKLAEKRYRQLQGG